MFILLLTFERISRYEICIHLDCVVVFRAAYVKAEACLMAKKPAMVQCDTDADPKLTKLVDERYRTGLIKPSAYQGKLCE
jgi:hypothetical protein